MKNGAADKINRRSVIAVPPRRLERHTDDLDLGRLQLIEDRLPVRCAEALGIDDIDADDQAITVSGTNCEDSNQQAAEYRRQRRREHRLSLP